MRHSANILGSFYILVLCTSCSTQTPPSPNPQQLVDRAIAAHGGEAFEHSTIEFQFRDRLYTRLRKQGTFVFRRQFTGDNGVVVDELTNSEFTRHIDGKLQEVTEEWAARYSNSINSVIYFALLPYRLNDPAVRKSLLGTTHIEGQKYHVVRVSFAQDGGGKDFQDIFLYWINSETFRVDYLAYSYESGEGGVRFRKAVNPRIVNGILFQDYLNYSSESGLNQDLQELPTLYLAGELKLLSKIELENVRVELGGTPP